MKFFLCVVVLTFFATNSFTQAEPCTCSGSIIFSAPRNEEPLTGKVIVEFDVDSMGLYSTPVVVKSLNPGHDSEALKSVKQMIRMWNSCRTRCKILLRQIPGSKRITVAFTVEQE